MVKLTRALSLFILFSLLLGIIPAGQLDLTTFFGPEVFIRGKGNPVTEIREFSTAGFQGPYILHLQNGDEDGNNRVSIAKVWINGDMLFGPSDFSQQVSGYDLEIELNEQNLLEVQIASKPGSKLKIWIEGVLLDLDIVLDYDNIFSSLINPEEGGKIETTGSNGTLYSLEIPANALSGQDDVPITMIPILRIDNFPLSGGLLAGVQFEPDGLQFVKPAILKFELPYQIPADEIIGFSYYGDGEDFHMVPMTIEGTEITFTLLSFSGWGAGKGTIEEFARLGGPENCDAKALQEMSPIIRNAEIEARSLTLEEKSAITNTLEGWYLSCVFPKLNLALDGIELDTAIWGFVKWKLCADEISEAWLDYWPPRLDVLDDEGNSYAYQCIKNEYNRVETPCVNSQVREDKIELLRRCIELQKLIDGVEDVIPGLGEFLLTYNGICGGALIHPDSISIEPAEKEINVNESITLEAIALDVNNKKIEDLDLELTWDKGETDAVELTPEYMEGKIVPWRHNAKGIKEGFAIITATAEKPFISTDVVSATANIKIVSNIKINPSSAEIWIGETIYLEVLDKDNNPINCPSLEWTIPPGGVVSVDLTDPIKIGVTGVKPGTVELIAACEGVTAEAKITVNEFDIRGKWRFIDVEEGQEWIYVLSGDLYSGIATMVFEGYVFQGTYEVDGSDIYIIVSYTEYCEGIGVCQFEQEEFFGTIQGPDTFSGTCHSNMWTFVFGWEPTYIFPFTAVRIE